ncbi:MAG: thiamine biosynthesis protein ThiS [Peptococcaceae bacterium BICA1-8]|nr:MAG: thiamine biosynthesis protein ThiS [Peptococcaceae bacterium BICA1-8]
MQIKVNGLLMEVVDYLNIMDLIQFKNLDPDTLVIQYNLEIIKKDEWATIILKENDELEILSFVGGG